MWLFQVLCTLRRRSVGTCCRNAAHSPLTIGTSGIILLRQGGTRFPHGSHDGSIRLMRRLPRRSEVRPARKARRNAASSRNFLPISADVGDEIGDAMDGT